MEKTTSKLQLQDVQTESLGNDQKQKIGLLGGAFNPPHIGHLIMADQVRNQLGLDEVWFVPTKEAPHHDGKVIDTSFEDRVNMVVRAIAGNSYFDLNTLEGEREGKSYTIDTIRVLNEKYPDKEFYFIIGADMVASLDSWHEIDDLVKMVQLVGVNRPGYERENNYPIIWVDIPSMKISSTQIRENIRQGQPVRYLVPNEVVAYIVEKGLYINGQN